MDDLDESRLWRLVTAIQNTLDSTQCSAYMSHLVDLCGNTVNATTADRIQALRSIGKWRDR